MSTVAINKKGYENAILNPITEIKSDIDTIREDININKLNIDKNKENIATLFNHSLEDKNDIKSLQDNMEKCKSQIGSNTDEIEMLDSRITMLLAKNKVLYKMTTAQWWCIGALTIISIILALT